MGDYTEIFFDQNEPLTIDDMSAISNNQQFLYEKIYQQAPRGAVLWHTNTGSISCSTTNAYTTLTGFSFTWTPESDRLYLLQFSSNYISAAAGAGNQKLHLGIFIGDKIVGVGRSSYMGPSTTNQPIHLVGIANSPLPEPTTVEVRYLLSESTAPSANVVGSAASPITFLIEDIGGSVTTLDYDNITIGDGLYG